MPLQPGVSGQQDRNRVPPRTATVGHFSACTIECTSHLHLHLLLMCVPITIACVVHHVDLSLHRFDRLQGLLSFQRLQSELSNRPDSVSRNNLMKAPTPGYQKTPWHGKVKHLSGGNMVDICSMVSFQAAVCSHKSIDELPVSFSTGPILYHHLAKSAWCTLLMFCPQACMLPGILADQFPSTLFVKDMLLRDNVQLSRHILVNCSVDNLTSEQRQNLAMMSHMKLTGTIQLQHCQFTICPVVDAAGDIKIIGFLLSI